MTKIINFTTMPGEIWKDIEGFDGRYQVSNLGRVYRLPFKDKAGNRRQGHILSSVHNNYGYPRVVVYKKVGGKSSYCMIHRLVAIHFIPNPDNKPHVNHKNGKRADYDISNLEWVDCSENMFHKFRVLGRKAARTPGLKGKDNPRSKKVRQIAIGGGLIKTYDSLADAAKAVNCTKGRLSVVIRGKSAGITKGYKWEYA